MKLLATGTRNTVTLDCIGTMGRGMRRVLTLALLLAGVGVISIQAALAQRVQGGSGSDGSVDPAAIARALKEVEEQMTHPDPDMRIGYLEAIVAEGNARKIERAVRIAVGSKDEALRALGARAYFVATRALPLDAVLTPAQARAVEEAKRDNKSLGDRALQWLAGGGFKAVLVFEPAPIGSIRGRVSVTGRNPVEYAMRGERMTFSSYTVIGGGVDCEWELRPTREMKIVATATCGSWGRLPFEADMF